VGLNLEKHTLDLYQILKEQVQVQMQDVQIQDYKYVVFKYKYLNWYLTTAQVQIQSTKYNRSANLCGLH